MDFTFISISGYWKSLILWLLLFFEMPNNNLNNDNIRWERRSKGLVWHLSNYHFSEISESFLHWNGQNKMVNEQFVCIKIWVHGSNLVTLIKIIIIEKQKIMSNDKTRWQRFKCWLILSTIYFWYTHRSHSG